MNFIPNLVLLVSLCCPFLIFLDYHKRSNILISVVYVIAFFSLNFLASNVIYNYGMIVAGSAPLILLGICLFKKK